MGEYTYHLVYCLWKDLERLLWPWSSHRGSLTPVVGENWDKKCEMSAKLLEVALAAVITDGLKQWPRSGVSKNEQWDWPQKGRKRSSNVEESSGGVLR